MSRIEEIASSTESCIVSADSDVIQNHIWFKTKPLDRSLLYHAAQLQLITESHDQGWVSDASAGSWSWFELAIYENEEADRPRVNKDGGDLIWRSHCNSLGLNTEANLKHFGAVFDRRKGLLDELELGNVIGVKVCARFPGWTNDAVSGKLVAKILDDDLFAPNPWSLESLDAIGTYTVTSPSECRVEAQDHNLASQIWFATPPLEQNVIEKIEEIQLFTNARNQGYAEDIDGGSWTWFDIVVLAHPEDTTPKIKNGRSLEWLSHTTAIGQDKDKYVAGLDFKRTHELLGALEANDVVAVRVCAQFSGWKHFAHDGRLILRVSTEGPAAGPVLADAPKYEAAMEENARIKEQMDKYFVAVSRDAPPAYSVEMELSLAPLRADQTYGISERPLRLLGLDGGGVRGISALVILKKLEETMQKLTGDATTKPCDYFDMIAGTSTGGLIAIMLGRLRMTVQECIERYKVIAKTVFDHGKIDKGAKLLLDASLFSGTILENVIKDVVKDKLGNPEALMLDPNPNACKVFVLACRSKKLNNELATRIRTYINPRVNDSFAKIPIWQAARATSAAPGYFPRIQIGNWDYVDGGMGFNNPSPLLWHEARFFFGEVRPVACLVSIGTGHPPNTDLGHVDQSNYSYLEKLKDAMIALVTNAEKAHQYLELMLPNPELYFRFNAGKEVAEKIYESEEGWFPRQTVLNHDPKNWEKIIDLEQWEAMPAYVAFTERYLKGEVKRIGKCADMMVKVK